METPEQLLVFSVDATLYGIDSDTISQILRVSEITPVPLMPASVRGLCSIEGSVAPVFDAKALIVPGGGRIDPEGYKARLLTMRNGAGELALMVESVESNMDIREENLEWVESDENDPVIGIYKTDHDVIQILSLSRLMAGIDLPVFTEKPVKDGGGGAAAESGGDSAARKYLVVGMGDERFALDADWVREIIFYPDQITPVAGSEPEVLGMTILRKQVLVCVDLRKSFGLEGKRGEQARVVILQRDRQAVGVLVDRIVEVRDIRDDQLEALNEGHNDPRITGIVKLDGRIVSIIGTPALSHLMESQGKTGGSHREPAGPGTEEKGAEGMEMVVFHLYDEEYGIRTEEVEEIIRYARITPVPDSPRYVRGIINLRGEVIPIVSLHERLGFPERLDENTKILVCRRGEQKIGFMVDSVTEVLDAPPSAITEDGNVDALFANVILLEKGERIILRIATERVLREEEAAALAETSQTKEAVHG